MTFWSQAIAATTGVIALIVTVAGWIFWFVVRWLESYRLARSSLYPFFKTQNVREHTLYYIESKAQNASSTEYPEPGEGLDLIAREPLIPKLLGHFKGRSKSPYRIPLLLADSGMGKTTLLINLALRYRRQIRPEWKILLVPLGDDNAQKRIRETVPEVRAQTILLLDALDEDLSATGENSRLTELMQATWDFRYHVVACRTQFYESIADIPRRTGLRNNGPNAGPTEFEPIFISPFTRRDIYKYLRKRFLWRFKFPQWSRAKLVVRKAEPLMARPMLLSYVDVLSLKPGMYDYNIQIYAELVGWWLRREAQKEDRDTVSFAASLRNLSLALAIDLWRHRGRRNGFQISEAELQGLAANADFNAEFLTKRQISSRSLLNRTADRKYKFAHLSIFEYFLSVAAYEQPTFGEKLRQADYDKVSQVPSFLLELMRAPLDAGCVWSGSQRELLSEMDSAATALLRRPYLLVETSEGLVMVCWTSTPPATAKIVLLLDRSFAVCLCHRSDITFNKSRAEEWAALMLNEPKVTRIFFHGTYLTSGQSVRDTFIAAFTRYKIPQNQWDVASDQ